MNKYYCFKLPTSKSSQTHIQVEDWEFSKLENPHRIIKNANGTFSVSSDQNFIPFTTQMYEKFKNKQLPNKDTYLGEAVLYRSAKLTDFISGDFINGKGYIVNNKVKSMLEMLNIGKHCFYNLPIIHKKNEINDYYYFKFLNDGSEYLDFHESKFILIHDFKDEFKEISINTSSEFNFYLEQYRSKKSEFSPAIKECKFLDSIPNYDLFSLSTVSIIHDFISEKAVNIFKEHKITGIDFFETRFYKYLD